MRTLKGQVLKFVPQWTTIGEREKARLLNKAGLMGRIDEEGRLVKAIMPIPAFGAKKGGEGEGSAH